MSQDGEKTVRQMASSGNREACGEAPGGRAPAGDLVVVRQDVLATVDHSFGNLFQRVYHLLRSAQAGVDGTLGVLEDSVRELQSLLELFVDYVAPTVAEARPVRCSDLPASLRHHFDDELGTGRVVVEERDSGIARVVADPLHLTRVFQLLARSLGNAPVEVLRCVCGLSANGGHFEIILEFPGNVATAHTELRWGLAEKLIELQGGELEQIVMPGGVTWKLRLPTAET